MITPEELWAEALLHCERAQTIEATEAARRLAIAAFYYATYHFTGRAVSLDTSASDSNHERLLQLLKHSREVHMRRAAQRYDGLKLLRVKSHYHLRLQIGAQELLVARNHARAVRALVRLEPA
ncbi:hypothetical protein SAMN02745121_07931 [Nannocystis exedens]|uniref:Uncharacterized protein n=1 Tax=Nannocystis exedens TaxID=54 RepID=A0A1I2HJB8_9BACT|nr:hypothetical protein [Nannocystis exedens]PCC70401.1 hypothetical protein NAEX_03444 [Nannocystis exedens]SFF28541.1 hypothetical protein SAMN02745121_07931 [Nannocystis exedens]